ncbi:MAG: YezD family protein [Candidatus Hydrogenedentes bacterium]|nr:YezD family protein [Candidatus Hydrogenedentota bacterium]
MNNTHPHDAIGNEPPANPYPEPEVRRRILEAIASLRYGSVEVTIHDGRVVQIDRKERIRLEATQRK